MAHINSVDTWERFKKSEIWLDMKDVLEQRLEQVRDGLEQTRDYDELCRLQGASDQIRFLLNLPDISINNLGESTNE